MNLAELRAQVLDYSWSYTSLGSWTMTFRYKKRRFCASYDGRKQEHTLLRRSSSPNSPDDWVVVWRQVSMNTAPPPEIIDAILEASGGG